ncbi:hypothetical protein N836_20330 [Leptolyngbya sp. Heron Island J]|nr:hypothetical protein N836_20330 [Leptolyngbya sp. Heron Island J]
MRHPSGITDKSSISISLYSGKKPGKKPNYLEYERLLIDGMSRSVTTTI